MRAFFTGFERRHGLRVRRPLPGQPGQEGVFVLVATAYGDRDGFWISPDDRPEPMTKVRSSWYDRARRQDG